MLPPIDESVLQSNPKFAALHTILKNNILNPTGSTKKHPAQKERDAVSEGLKAARIRASKRHLIRSALSSLDLTSSATSKSTTKSTSKPLPAELLELILLLSARLSTSTLPQPSIKLLESTSQWASLSTHLPTLGSLISSHLHSQALALTRIHTPTTNPSYLHRGIPKLVSSIASTQSEIAEKKTDLAKRRTALVGKTTTVLGLYHEAITLIIQILEQTKHGSISRYSKTRAEYLSLQAKTLELEIKEKGIRGEKIVYTEQVRNALENYMVNLRDGMERLGEREREAKRVLWGYGVGREEKEKEKVMREIARVYGELVREVGEVSRDVERLRGK